MAVAAQKKPRITERKKKKKKKQKLPKDAKVDEMSVCCNERESRAAFFFFPLFQKSIEHSLTTALSLLFGCTGHKAAAVAIGNGKEQLKIFALNIGERPKEKKMMRMRMRMMVEEDGEKKKKKKKTVATVARVRSSSRIESID